MNNFDSIQSLNEFTKMYKSYQNSNDIIRSYQNLKQALITKASIHMSMKKEEIKKIFEHEDSSLFDELTEEKVLLFSQQYIKKKKLQREKWKMNQTTMKHLMTKKLNQ